jgi:hypothetical protein
MNTEMPDEPRRVSTRRDFLRTSLITGGGLTMGTAALTNAAAPESQTSAPVHGRQSTDVDLTFIPPISEEQDARVDLTFIESTESQEAIRAKIPHKQLLPINLWVRTPDSELLERVRVAARLCSCRQVCLAVIEDEL